RDRRRVRPRRRRLGSPTGAHARDGGDVCPPAASRPALRADRPARTYHRAALRDRGGARRAARRARAGPPGIHVSHEPPRAAPQQRERAEAPTRRARDPGRGVRDGRNPAGAKVSLAPAAASWRRYPYVLVPSDPELVFPAAEGDQGAHSNTYYLAGRLHGVQSGRTWAYLTVFTFNRFRGWLRSDFYTLALFDLHDGRYATYTEHDLPRPPLPRWAYKLTVAAGHLDLAFASREGPCRWT